MSPVAGRLKLQRGCLPEAPRFQACPDGRNCPGQGRLVAEHLILLTLQFPLGSCNADAVEASTCALDAVGQIDQWRISHWTPPGSPRTGRQV